MTDLDLPRIAKKLSGMSRRMDLLKKYESVSLEGYLSLDEEHQATIERFLEIIIQAAIDISKMLLTQVLNIDLRQGNEPITNAALFLLVGEYGFISMDLSKKLAKSGQFRNVLAHLYDDIDPKQVYMALQNLLVYYPEYIQAIQDYIDTLEVS